MITGVTGTSIGSGASTSACPVTTGVTGTVMSLYAMSGVSVISGVTGTVIGSGVSITGCCVTSAVTGTVISSGTLISG